jgi:hypothetical protein
MKNISVITTIGLLEFDKLNPPMPAGISIDFDDIPDIENTLLIRHTFESASFLEQKKRSPHGPVYSKSINLRSPAFSENLENALAPYFDKPLILFIGDANATWQLVYPLFVQYDKNNPGTATGYRGYSINFEGNYHKPSIFVKNVADLSEIEYLGEP